MAEIKPIPLFSHLRSEPTMHTIQYRKGKLARSGKGLAFWFRPLSSSIVEVPLDDQELQILFHGRTRDFQDVTVQGVITYRVKDPAIVANRIDFAIDLTSGKHIKAPLEQLGGLLGQLSQQFVLDYLAKAPLREVFEDGLSESRRLIEEGLGQEERIQALGIEIVAVRISSLKPSSEVEKALQTPAREAIQQKADEAMFGRRALAVEKERAIEENELQNKIELAKREELLLTQEGQNSRRQAQERAAAEKIKIEGEAERAHLLAKANAEQGEITARAQAKNKEISAQAEAANKRVLAKAEAESIELVEGARVESEKERVGIYAELSPQVLLGLAAGELAGKLQNIEHINISPDMVSPVLANFLQAKTDELKD